jgi:hypothetical protein
MPGLRILLLGMFALTLLGQSENNAVPNPGGAIETAVRGMGIDFLNRRAENLVRRAIAVRLAKLLRVQNQIQIRQIDIQ